MSSIIIVRVSAADKQAHRRFKRVYEKWRRMCDQSQAGDQNAAEATGDRAAALSAEFEALVKNSAKPATSMPTRTRVNSVVDRIIAETEFLESEIARSRTAAIEKRSRDNSGERYRRLASSLLNQPGAKFSGEMSLQLKNVAEGSVQPDSAENILRQVLEAGTDGNRPPAGSTANQSEILAQLKQGLPSETLGKWISRNNDPQWRQLESYIAELELFFPQAAAAFAARLAELKQDGSGSGLLLDSLVLDLAEAVKRQRQAASDMETLSGMIEDIQPMIGETDMEAAAEDFVNRAARTMAGQAVEEIEPLMAEGRRILDELDQRRTAEASRREILAGLAELGYEVRESAITIWREEGRLVLADKGSPQYGLEIGGDAGRRLQFRPVGLTAEVDGRRDYEVETAWCGKFEKLRERLAVSGPQLEVEKMIDPGAAPLKRLADTSRNLVSNPGRPRTKAK